MWEPRPSDKFEPSLNTKNAWMFTRKSPYTPAAGTTFPGLCTTKGFDTDAIVFAAVICLEAWGLVSLISSFGLFGPEGNFNWLGVGGVVAAFILDLTLAIGRHIPAGRECKYKNKDVLAETPHEKEALRKERGRLWLLSPLCAVLISALAAFKIFLFYELNASAGITGLTASVFVSYVLAAIIHINNTGYFAAACWFSHKVKKDYRIWAGNGAKAPELTIYRRRRFDIVIPDGDTIKINLAKAGEHLIRAGDKARNEAAYVLETYGILTDRGLQDLVGQQPTTSGPAKKIVAEVGLHAQLRILEEEPPLPNSEIENGQSNVRQDIDTELKQREPVSVTEKV